MNEVFDSDYWTGLQTHIDDNLCTSSWDLATTSANVLQALQGYAEWLEIAESSSRFTVTGDMIKLYKQQMFKVLTPS